MKTFHNPDRFMSDLRQVLSQGRKRIGLLVGAGAPMSIRLDAKGKLASGGKSLMPGVEELTKSAIESLTGQNKVAAEAIRTELGAGANIESILTRIRLLHQALGPGQRFGATTSCGVSTERRRACPRHPPGRRGAILSAKDPTFLGMVTAVSGPTVTVKLAASLSSGMALIKGHLYRVAQVGSFVRIPQGYQDLFGIVSEVGATADASGVVRVVWAGNMSQREIDRGRRLDRAAKDQYYGGKTETDGGDALLIAPNPEPEIVSPADLPTPSPRPTSPQAAEHGFWASMLTLLKWR